MKIGASTLATFNDSLKDSLEFIESLGIEYAELLHQYPNEEFDLDIFLSEMKRAYPFEDEIVVAYK